MIQKGEKSDTFTSPFFTFFLSIRTHQKAFDNQQYLFYVIHNLKSILNSVCNGLVLYKYYH